MYPWERRLRDLAQLLRNCGDTYFFPDRFRQNTNQFLQTSRTVTFIIQKNKATIPDFDAWYKANVNQPWATDQVMTWAKDARNVIEKEGDLEMHSMLRAAVLYSYMSDEDMILDITRKELLQAGLDRLLHIARQKLPPGIADAAVLKIQRRWVANSLPNRELIYALTYAYSELYRVCNLLAAYLGLELDPSIPHPTSVDPSSKDVAHVRFIKLSKPGVGQHTNVHISADPSYKPPPALLLLKSELAKLPKPTSLSEVVKMHTKMAKAMFEHYGNHVPMLTLYDKDWSQIDCISTLFSDQAEKYLFWSNIADRAFYLKAYALVWTSETWLRDLKGHRSYPIRELPIVGEQLHVIGADAEDSQVAVAWNINRTNSTSHPLLDLVDSSDAKHLPGEMFFVKPVVAAMKMTHAHKEK